MKLSASPSNKIQKQSLFVSLLCSALFALFITTLPAHAADLFNGAKQDITDTTGEGSAVHLALMAAGLIVSMITGYIAKNWVAGVAVFVIGVVFWSVGSGMVFS